MASRRWKVSHGKTIFVAGASSERDEVATVIELLRAAGWEVVADWPAMQAKEPKIKSPEHAARIATELENAIRSASFFWYMLPRTKSEGAAYEFGFFRGIRDRDAHGFTIVSGDHDALGRLYPFASGKSTSFSDHILALNFLCGLT
jgi:hypothetical protein